MAEDKKPADCVAVAKRADVVPGNRKLMVDLAMRDYVLASIPRFYTKWFSPSLSEVSIDIEDIKVAEAKLLRITDAKPVDTGTGPIIDTTIVKEEEK